jgi:hypothetical protein
MSDDMKIDVPGMGKVRLVDVTEFQCPCGLKVWEGELPEHPGDRAVIHKEPRCAEFDRMAPLDYIGYCARKRVLN